MAKGAASDRLERLERLKGLLKAGDSLTVKELARELDISVRSLSRDIELLRSSGVPIDADRGRGGGVRLQRQWSFGRLHLDLEEGIDLLLSIAVAERLNSPLLLKRLHSIRQKLATSFPEAQQSRIKMLRNRILIGPPASEQVMKTYRMNAPEQLTNVARGIAFEDAFAFAPARVERGVLECAHQSSRVTRSTSSMVVSPLSTFARPSSRMEGVRVRA